MKRCGDRSEIQASEVKEDPELREVEIYALTHLSKEAQSLVRHLVRVIVQLLGDFFDSVFFSRHFLIEFFGSILGSF